MLACLHRLIITHNEKLLRKKVQTILIRFGGGGISKKLERVWAAGVVGSERDDARWEVSIAGEKGETKIRPESWWT